MIGTKKIQTFFSSPQTASRRSFFRQLGGVFAGSLLLTSGLSLNERTAQADTLNRRSSMSGAHKCHFYPYKGDNFTVRIDGKSSAQLQLEEVEDLSPQLNLKHSEKRQESYSLLFRGKENVHLPQSTYRIEHAQMGRFDLFIVPIDANEQGVQYEAIINRLVG